MSAARRERKQRSSRDDTEIRQRQSSQDSFKRRKHTSSSFSSVSSSLATTSPRSPASVSASSPIDTSSELVGTPSSPIVTRTFRGHVTPGHHMSSSSPVSHVSSSPPRFGPLSSPLLESDFLQYEQTPSSENDLSERPRRKPIQRSLSLTSTKGKLTQTEGSSSLQVSSEHLSSDEDFYEEIFSQPVKKQKIVNVCLFEKPVNVANEHLYLPVDDPDVQKASMDRIERLVWRWVVEREPVFLPSAMLFQRHPSLHPKIRYIVIDWLCEVADEFKLQRETLHLSLNYMDRYLSLTQNVVKEQMQLLGITALFLAAKLEEVNPPIVTDYAKVTAGAHTAKDIKTMELTVLHVLEWRMSALTANMWVNLFLQNAVRHQQMEDEKADEVIEIQHDTYKYFYGPKFEGERFYRVMSIVDVAVHHVESLQFAPSLLAAAAVKIVGRINDGIDATSFVTGYSDSQLERCMNWLKQFQYYPVPSLPKKMETVHTHSRAAWFNLQRHCKELLPHLNECYEALP